MMLCIALCCSDRAVRPLQPGHVEPAADGPGYLQCDRRRAAAGRLRSAHPRGGQA
jgi:hypothetical protein